MKVTVACLVDKQITAKKYILPHVMVMSDRLLVRHIRNPAHRLPGKCTDPCVLRQISKSNFHSGCITPGSGQAVSALWVLCTLAFWAFSAYHALCLVHHDSPFSFPSALHSSRSQFHPTTVSPITFSSPASGVPLPNCLH